MENTICPKCNYKRGESATDSNTHPGECPKCGIVYAKYYDALIRKLHSQNKNLSDRINEMTARQEQFESRLDQSLNENSRLRSEYDEKITTLSNRENNGNISFKQILIPLWIIIFLNVSFFIYEASRYVKVGGFYASPVYIQGASGKIPISAESDLPVSIEHVAGNLPVNIKAPLSVRGTVCANPCSD